MGEQLGPQSSVLIQHPASRTVCVLVMKSVKRAAPADTITRMGELPKVFEHREVDPKWYVFWEQIGAFRADSDSERPPFSMVLPPPNVTGRLHIGHALNQTLPDIIARWKRMQGFDVLWLPGTDHAGIATQNVVERQLAVEGQTRQGVGREAFEARVWEWTRQNRSTITGQMRTLGSSVDWSRERFTLDDSLSRAVRHVFVSLYREGLIYRGKYIVNWCPRCRTALSDLEVVHKDTSGTLYYVRYPYVTGTGAVTVATTRPETMLGDTGVAVHPDDERYRRLVGQRVRLPVIGRALPVIADDFVDPAFGTGAVKVTPAHDPNDFAMGQRHGLAQVVVIDEDGRMTQDAGPYAGQDRFEARAGVIKQLEHEGLLVKVEDHRHAVGHCQRCGTIVEPLVSTQWFVRIKPLAEPAIQAVKENRTTFVPDNWAKTYFEWMTNIHDWCISRQLWWGHRIPAWYCDACGEMVVQEETPTGCRCGQRLRQETDVLDKWFSSGLLVFHHGAHHRFDLAVAGVGIDDGRKTASLCDLADIAAHLRQRDQADIGIAAGVGGRRPGDVAGLEAGRGHGPRHQRIERPRSNHRPLSESITKSSTGMGRDHRMNPTISRPGRPE